jgi:hypothetical protein
MRSVPSELNDELLKEANFLCHLLTLHVSSTLRYTDLDIDLYYAGQTYQSRGLKFDDAEYSLTAQVDKMSFEIDNVSLEFSSLVLNEEVRGKNVDCQLCALSYPAKVIAVGTVFSGILDSVSINPKRARFEVYSPLALWRKKTPRRIHQLTCPKPFKGMECGYSGGETWCDQSFERCDALVNTDNFGGYRFLAELQNKPIWWGRESK